MEALQWSALWCLKKKTIHCNLKGASINGLDYFLHYPRFNKNSYGFIQELIYHLRLMK